MENSINFRAISICIFICIFFIPTLASAYVDTGSMNAHSVINRFAIVYFEKSLMSNDQFLKPPLTSLNGQSSFGYAWDPEDQGGPGDMSLAPDIRPDVSVSPKSKALKSWIINGGYSADEPEGPSALVHFYDPTNENEKYLTDQQIIVDILHLWNSENANPKIDARQWGLVDLGDTIPGYGVNFVQGYSYEDAKKNFVKALEKDTNNNELYGKAWRGVGETMHMISDMTVPAHVRNDGHASVLRDSDPYESTTSYLQVAENVKRTPANIDYKTDLFTLMDSVALFTNNNFFSKDTIQQRPDMISYKIPDISSMESDSEGYSINTVDGQKLKAAKTNSWIKKALGARKSTFSWLIDEEVVIDQRKILIPTAIRASAAVLDRFLPRFVANMNYELEDPEKPDSGIYVMHGSIKLADTKQNKEEWPDKLTINNGAWIVITGKDGKVMNISVDPKVLEGSMNEFSYTFSAKPDDKVNLMYDLGGYVVFATKQDQVKGLQPGVWKFTGKPTWPNEIAIIKDKNGKLSATYSGPTGSQFHVTFEEKTVAVDSKNIIKDSSETSADVSAANKEMYEYGIRAGFFTADQNAINTFRAIWQNPDTSVCSIYDIYMTGVTYDSGRKFIATYVQNYECNQDTSSFIDEEMKGERLREYSGGTVDGSYPESKVNNDMPVGANPLANESIDPSVPRTK